MSPRETAMPPQTVPSPAEKTDILGYSFDNLDCAGAVARIRARDPVAPFGYVTTPNVDHIVRLRTEDHSDEVHRAYAAAEMTLCDSRVMAVLARRHGVQLTVASGSDVTEALLEAERGTDEHIVLIGGDETTLSVLAERYGFTNLSQHIPPFGLMNNQPALDAAADYIVANPARYVFIAVGSPQQEVIAFRASQRAGIAGFGLCIGASIDYLTGRSRRAPMILRALALEWLYRLIREPRRLWHRYLVRSPKIFRLMDRSKPRD